MTAVSTPGTRHNRGLWGQVLKHRWCYVFMVPTLVLSALFTFYPIFMSWYFSFLEWSGYTSERTWVGLDNYARLIHDAAFWGAFGRSFLFVLVAVPIKLALSLLLAILLNNESMKLSPVFRTMFFLPVVTTAAIVGIIMTFVLDPFNGPVNEVLTGTGLVDQAIDFRGDKDTALWTVMGVEIWKNMGITMVYWLAALQTVPATYYEAARIDGAGRWHLLRHITVPILAPFAAIITLLTANQTLHVFAIVQAMTQGGPARASEVMEVYIYREAFVGDGGLPELGYASAAGVFFGLAVMVVALLQIWVAKKAQSMRAAMGSER